MLSKATARNLLLTVLPLSLFVGTASAQFSVTITFNESGAGRLTNTNGANVPLPASTPADPGPGGKAKVLFYTMLNPPGLTVGDLLITDANNTVSDILRFNPSLSGGGVFVYSSDTAHGLTADVGLPSANNANTKTVAEPANCVVLYTPTSGQPGFVAGAGGPVHYSFTSAEEVNILKALASPNVLWPPNHKFTDVSVSTTAIGGCGALTCKIISVTSSEPTAGTNAVASGDAVITGNLTLELRAERSGTDDAGRTYTITVQCTDVNGDASTKTVTVLVPHDQGNGFN